MFIRIIKTFTRPITRGKFKTVHVVDGNIIDDTDLSNYRNNYIVTSFYSEKVGDISIKTTIMVRGNMHE